MKESVDAKAFQMFLLKYLFRKQHYLPVNEDSEKVIMYDEWIKSNVI